MAPRESRPLGLPDDGAVRRRRQNRGGPQLLPIGPGCGTLSP